MTKEILITLSILLLSGLLFVAIHMVLRQLRSKIDVIKYVKGSPVRVIANVKHNQGKAAEAFLPEGEGGLKAVGRVIIEKSGDKAIVQILESDVEEETSDPIFKRCGYIAEDGYIYSQPIKNGPVTRVGYVARPSKPDEPCMKGERSWKTLWLHALLDVYLFNPQYMEDVDPSALLSGDARVGDSDGLGVRRDQRDLSPEEILEDIKHNMVFVEGGTFTMGAPRKESGLIQEDGKERGMVEENESPEHSVTLDSYGIGRFPVTQAEWKAVMGENPSDARTIQIIPSHPFPGFSARPSSKNLMNLPG